jgi:hypothetical protein
MEEFVWNFNGWNKGGIIAEGTVTFDGNSDVLVKKIGHLAAKKLKSSFVSEDGSRLTWKKTDLKVSVIHYVENDWGYSIDSVE